MKGSLLTDTSGNFFIRWDDDVVFKNCAKGEDEKKKVSYLCEEVTKYLVTNLYISIFKVHFIKNLVLSRHPSRMANLPRNQGCH